MVLKNYEFFKESLLQVDSIWKITTFNWKHVHQLTFNSGLLLWVQQQVLCFPFYLHMYSIHDPKMWNQQIPQKKYQRSIK